MSKDPLAGGQEQKVEYNNIKFGKVGDWFKGTLMDNTRQMANQLSDKKEMQTVFEFKMIDGAWHDIVDRTVSTDTVDVKVGENYSFITGKQAILQQMKGVPLGTIVGMKFTEEQPAKTKGYNKSKIIKVYLFGMDPEYKGAEDGGVW